MWIDRNNRIRFEGGKAIGDGISVLKQLSYLCLTIRGENYLNQEDKQSIKLILY